MTTTEDSGRGPTADEYNQLIAGVMREAQLQAQTEHLARGLGWLAYHTHTSVRSAPGFPDLVLVRGQRIVYAELKSARGAVTPAQRQWLDALEAAGAETYVWRPIDLLNQTIATVLQPQERPATP